MIVQLRGTVVMLSPTTVIMDVGGVGYELGISTTTAADIPPKGTENVVLLTRMVVKEDAQQLYGFSTKEERQLFDKLRAISGIGPKSALSILSFANPAQLALIVATQDVQKLTQTPGIGKKTASKILIDLADAFKKDESLKHIAPSATAPQLLDLKPEQASSPAVIDEAVEALLGMGFTQQEAELALQGAAEAGITQIEKLVTYALRRLGGGK